MRAIAVLFASFVASTGASAGVDTFMGIKFGAKFDESSLPRCTNSTPEALCIESASFPGYRLKGVPISSIDTDAFLMVSPDGLAQEIVFSGTSGSYAQVKQVLTQRFGAPTKVEQSEVQNRMSARFDQEASTWEWATFKIELTKRSRMDLDKLSFRAIDKSLEEKRLQRRQEALKGEAEKL